MKNIYIVGGGITGCFLSFFLKNDFNVSIYEKENTLGGLCKTYENIENLKYQHGTHVLHTNSLWIIDLIKQFIPLDEIDYRVGIHPLFDFRYYDLPFTTKNLQFIPWHWKESILS